MNKRFWPVAGFCMGFLASMAPVHRCLSVGEAGVIWLFVMAAVLLLSMSGIGRRLTALGSGIALAVPCFVCGSPLAGCAMEALMALPFVVAAALVFAPPLDGIRAHLFHVMSWCGARSLSRVARRMDGASVGRLLVATVVCGVALALVPGAGSYVTRWFYGGVAVLAFAEMFTMAFVVLTGLAGVSAPLIMESPHLARSIAEFWSRRWNPSTSELLFRRQFFKPFARQGPELVVVAAFVVSGLVHAVLAYIGLRNWRMSLLCGAFFAVQPVFVVAERWLRVRTWRPAAAHAWTLAALAVTSPLFVEPLLQLLETNGVDLRDIKTVTTLAISFVLAVSGAVTLLSLVALPPEKDGVLVYEE